ncbi:MAG TPA: DNA-directed RNA polymerase subunit omega [Azospirillaceae bacterium]|nr:DNA-directed RNA polymerase subunit omega [Azospirillaceae bacterium]
MARVTVEDCTDKIANRFELVMIASQRARQLSAGAPLVVERDDDKNAVVALREIAAASVAYDKLREALVNGHRRDHDADAPPADDVQDLLEEAQGLMGPAPTSLNDGLGEGGIEDDEVTEDENAADHMEDLPGDMDGDHGNLVDRNVVDSGRAYNPDEIHEDMQRPADDRRR